jgi:uncharacterized protein (UPF0371 family)|tara:strand:- start:468 stop:749 length:282 start_codon:yes stop_codon:yes gene_type:complete
MELHDKIEVIKEKLHKFDITVTKNQADLKHIKDRIDNGISNTITKIWDKLNEITPAIKDNTFWVGKVKWGISFLAIAGVGGGLVTLVFYFVRQ